MHFKVEILKLKFTNVPLPAQRSTGARKHIRGIWKQNPNSMEHLKWKTPVFIIPMVIF
jgi:hypothetical protein